MLCVHIQNNLFIQYSASLDPIVLNPWDRRCHHYSRIRRLSCPSVERTYYIESVWGQACPIHAVVFSQEYRLAPVLSRVWLTQYHWNSVGLHQICQTILIQGYDIYRYLGSTQLLPQGFNYGRSTHCDVAKLLEIKWELWGSESSLGSEGDLYNLNCTKYGCLKWLLPRYRDSELGAAGPRVQTFGTVWAAWSLTDFPSFSRFSELPRVQLSFRLDSKVALAIRFTSAHRAISVLLFSIIAILLFLTFNHVK